MARRTPLPAQVLDPDADPQRAARRRPRATRPYGLRLRVALVEAQPPVERELEVPSTLHLDEVHALLQAVSGWTDSHLHRFTLGESAFAREDEQFLCPYDVQDGEDDGVPASDVRLDEVLREVGDELRYTYDYGDEWQLLLSVLEVLPEPPAVRVVGGQGAAPGEDLGGVWAWNERTDDRDGTPYDPAALARAVSGWERERLLPPPLRELRRQLGGTPGSRPSTGWSTTPSWPRGRSRSTRRPRASCCGRTRGCSTGSATASR